MASSPASTIVSATQRRLLERCVAVCRVPQSVALRARFPAGGPAALPEVRPGRGRKRTISAAKVKAIMAATGALRR
jgi:hypothetical protein